MMSEASFRALADFCSPSAAMTLGFEGEDCGDYDDGGGGDGDDDDGGGGDGGGDDDDVMTVRKYL